MLEVLRLTDESDIVRALQMLLENILKELGEFVGYYNQKTKIFNGPRPTLKTVRIVKEWFVHHKRAPSTAHRVSMAKSESR
jgi:hypothetical protein